MLIAGFNLQAQNNTVYGAGISYTNGAPTWTPNPRTSRAAVDTVTGRWYHFNTPGGWQWIGNTIEEIGGCAAPAYTPNKGDSRLVINNCTKPEVYWYDGSVWKWINQGEVYTAGQGIRIESNSIILDSLYLLRFRTGSNTDGSAGTMQWNGTEETVDLVTDQGLVTGHLMESVYYNTRNTTGTPIPISYVVMANGTTGNTGRILIAPAIADGSVNSEYILGLTAQAIGNNSNGKVQHFGKIKGIQTNGANFGETWSDGDVLYCSAATPGYLTKVVPTAPNLKVPIAIVVHAHPTNGTLFVRPSHYPDLAQINDVQLSSPTNGQVITYNSANQRWEAATPANQLQTLSTDGTAGNISISSGNTITLNVNDADASATNELQMLSVAANTATLSNSGGSVTIAGAGINTVGTAGTTITVTGTEIDGSTTNELQTLSTGTNTLTLSNGGGTVTVDTDPTNDVTGSGASGQVSFWTGAQTQGGDNGLFWNNTDKRLGLGTTTPTLPFQIERNANSAQNIWVRNSNTGNNAYAGIAAASISVSPSTTGTVELRAYPFGHTIWPSRGLIAASSELTNGMVFITSSASPIEFWTNNARRAIVSSTGEFSIGTTSAAARLHVVGSGTSSSTWTAQFHNSAGNNNALMIRDDGNVGIGTNNPTAALTIGASQIFTVTSSGVTTWGVSNSQGFLSWDTNLAIFGGRQNSDVQFRTNSNVNVMRLTTGGNVGIGTTSPNASAALDVTSTTQGILFPRMTTTQRNAISTPADGLVIYNTTDNKLQVRAGGAWVNLH